MGVTGDSYEIHTLSTLDLLGITKLYNMKVLILAGGLGSRLSEETTLKPKPMVEIGGKPIQRLSTLNTQFTSTYREM